MLGIEPLPVRTPELEAERVDLRGISAQYNIAHPESMFATMEGIDAAANGPLGAYAVMATQNKDANYRRNAYQAARALDNLAFVTGSAYAAKGDLFALRYQGVQGRSGVAVGEGVSYTATEFNGSTQQIGRGINGANTAATIETAAVNGPKVFATFNGNVVEPVLTNQPLFHGVNMTWDEITNAGGLPTKGTDIDLLNHLNGGPNSAFRGTNFWADSPLANGNGPVSWAGEGGTVVKIDGSRIPSYDANSLTSGSVRKFYGSFADHTWTGEAEFPIHAQVPLDAITHYGVVVESRSGALRVQQWIENPYYKK